MSRRLPCSSIRSVIAMAAAVGRLPSHRPPPSPTLKRLQPAVMALSIPSAVPAWSLQVLSPGTRTPSGSERQSQPIASRAQRTAACEDSLGSESTLTGPRQPFEPDVVFKCKKFILERCFGEVTRTPLITTISAPSSTHQWTQGRRPALRRTQMLEWCKRMPLENHYVR